MFLFLDTYSSIDVDEAKVERGMVGACWSIGDRGLHAMLLCCPRHKTLQRNR